MIKISQLTRERREGKALFTHDSGGEIRTDEIRISFLKPTEALWRELVAIEEAEGAEEKATYVAQFTRLDLQSPDITEDDGTPHRMTERDYAALDLKQLAELWAGARAHFFLQTPQPESETTTSSVSAPAES